MLGLISNIWIVFSILQMQFICDSCLNRKPDPCENQPHKGQFTYKFNSEIVPVHPSKFSFHFFPGFLAIFILLSSNNNNLNRKIFLPIPSSSLPPTLSSHHTFFLWFQHHIRIWQNQHSFLLYFFSSIYFPQRRFPYRKIRIRKGTGQNHINVQERFFSRVI